MVKEFVAYKVEKKALPRADNPQGIEFLKVFKVIARKRVRKFTLEVDKLNF